MKEKIKDILDSWKEIKFIKQDKFERENIVLSCINLLEKSVNSSDFSNIEQKQKKVAFELLNVNESFYNKIDNLGIVLKGLDEESLKKGKISPSLLCNLMYSRINKEDLNTIKEIFKSFKEEVYSDINFNKKLNRIGKTYSNYILNLKNYEKSKNK